MENQDKIYQQFKDASGKAEDKGFDRMEAVWNRVEEKLENKKQRNIATWWKYTGIAALFLLFMGIGTFMLKNETNPIVAPKVIQENNVTVIDTQKVKETFNPEIKGFTQEVVTSEPSPRNKVEQVEETISPTPKFKKSAVIVSEEGQRTANVETKPNADAISESRTKQKAISTEPESLFNVTIYDATIAPSVVEPDKKGDITFQGVITDSSGMPVPGVTVVFDGTKKGVLTDFDGKFTLNVNEGDKIALSNIGMEPQSIIASQTTNNATFIMNDSSVALSDVVVEGYRSTTKAMSNVAATTTVSKSVEGRGNANYIQALPKEYNNDDNQSNSNTVTERKTKETEIATTIIEGRDYYSIRTLQDQVPGLNITTGSGQPGTSNTVINRSYASLQDNIEPLYVIDGRPLDQYIVRKINPNDIIDIKILKDAKALEVYGKMGINGVVIVKTKKPFTKRELKKFKREKEKLEKENAKRIQD